jgi:hypothetical protein
MLLLLFVFALLVAYQLKHFLADYIFQGEYQLGKFKPGWDFFLPLLSHVAYHFAGTALIAGATFFLFGLQGFVPLVLLLGLFDATIHFFMDRIKAGPKYMGRWKPVTGYQYMDHKATLAAKLGDPRGDFEKYDDIFIQSEDKANARKALRGNKLFWWALGFDQMVHHLTHYVCIFIIVLAAVLP